MTLLVCKYYKFQDSKKIIIGVDMFSAMSKDHASYTSILLSEDFIWSSFVSLGLLNIAFTINIVDIYMYFFLWWCYYNIISFLKIYR